MGLEGIKSTKVSCSGTRSYLAYESEIREGNQHEFNKQKSKFYPKVESRGQSAMYATTLTTPQGVTSEQPNTAVTSQPLRALAASPDVTSCTQIGREERQPLVLSTFFIRQQIEVGVNDLMQEVSK